MPKHKDFRLIPPWFRGAVRLNRPPQILHYPFRCHVCGGFLPEGTRVIGTPFRVSDDEGDLETVFVHADPCNEAAVRPA